MIKLADFLNIEKYDYCDYKVHFAIGAKDRKEPYNEFLIGGFDKWQSIQTNKNFNRQYVVSLIYFEKDVWMFAGVYKVDGKPISIEHNGKSLWQYPLSKIDVQQDMIGRAFFTFKKEFRASYPCLELVSNDSTIADMQILFIADKQASITDFDGFDSINVDYSTLKYIVDNNIPSWKAALSNAKGVYLIVDTKTGKQYVGSAYGSDCIWQRWHAYAKNGHGGNIELKNLLQQKGEEYKNNFKYSVLEICNMNLGSEYVISRENYWKNALMTRQFGLNKN